MIESLDDGDDRNDGSNADYDAHQGQCGAELVSAQTGSSNAKCFPDLLATKKHKEHKTKLLTGEILFVHFVPFSGYLTRSSFSI